MQSFGQFVHAYIIMRKVRREVKLKLSKNAKVHADSSLRCLSVYCQLQLAIPN